jgi:hypothetical protein
MKKLGMMLVTFLLAADAWPAVRIIAEEEGNLVVSIKYQTDGEKVRAFALDVTITSGTIDAIFDYHVGESTAANPGYGIFPGSFGRYITVDPDTGEVVNWDVNGYTPVADPYSPGALGGLGTNGITIEMAALYYPPDDSSPNAPPNNGTLCKIRVTEDCSGSICQNATRGGIVLTDPTVYPIVNLTRAHWPEWHPVPHDCFPTNNPAFSDWVAVGKPDCWCAFPRGSGYQCDGDADGRSSGFPFKYRVFIGDLALIVENWKKKVDDPMLNPCADIDHKDSGFPFNYRVFINDLAILVNNWKKKDNQLPGDCPR